MPTTVIFDNALLADAVNKAARISPTKGAAFDKAAGIFFSVNLMKRTCMVRSTDLEISFEQEIPILEGKGYDAQWRIPASILQSLVSTLPMTEGNTTDFIDRGDECIRFKSGRTVAKLHMYDIMSFPQGIFDWTEGELSMAQDIIHKVDQVSWACDRKSTSILSGVHMDGEALYATDTHALAVVPTTVSVDAPITVPLASLSVIMKSASDCRIRAFGHRFQIALDETTRATTNILEGRYPPVKNVMRSDFLASMKVHRQGFLDTLGRLLVLSKQEKLPTLSIEVNGGGLVSVLTFDMDIPGVGRMQDSIDVETDFDGVFTLGILPALLNNAVDKARGDYVEIDFGHENPDKSSLQPIQIRDKNGYRCYIMPKRN